MALDPKIVLDLDPWLKPFIPAIATRYDIFTGWKSRLQSTEGGYEKFSKGFLKYGFNVRDDGTIVYQEWAPAVIEAVLIGDFSQ